MVIPLGVLSHAAQWRHLCGFVNEGPSALCLVGLFVSCFLKPVQGLSHSTGLPVVEPGINAKTCQLNFSKSLPFCFASSRQNAARTASNLVSGRAGEKTLLLNDSTGACGLFLSASTLLPLLGAADFSGTFLKPQIHVQSLFL